MFVCNRVNKLENPLWELKLLNKSLWKCIWMVFANIWVCVCVWYMEAIWTEHKQFRWSHRCHQPFHKLCYKRSQFIFYLWKWEALKNWVWTIYGANWKHSISQRPSITLSLSSSLAHSSSTSFRINAHVCIVYNVPIWFCFLFPDVRMKNYYTI